MSKVAIPKELANIIETVKEEHDSVGSHIFRVVRAINDVRVSRWGLTYTDIIRAIEEGYEVEIEKEYLSLEQVFKLSNGVRLKHERKGNLVFMLIGNAMHVLHGDGAFRPSGLCDYMLDSKWYLSDINQGGDVR